MYGLCQPDAATQDSSLVEYLLFGNPSLAAFGESNCRSIRQPIGHPYSHLAASIDANSQVAGATAFGQCNLADTFDKYLADSHLANHNITATSVDLLGKAVRHKVY